MNNNQPRTKYEAEKRAADVHSVMKILAAVSPGLSDIVGVAESIVDRLAQNAGARN